MKGLRLWLMVATLLATATTVHAMPPTVALWQALQAASQHVCQEQAESRCQAAQCPAAGETNWFHEGVRQTLASWQRLRALCASSTEECPQTEGCCKGAEGVAAKVGSSGRTLGCRTDGPGYARDAQGQKPQCCASSATGACMVGSGLVSSIAVQEAIAAAPCCCAKACACCETCTTPKKEAAQSGPTFSVWASLTVDLRVGSTPSVCPVTGAARGMLPPTPASPVWTPVLPHPVAVHGFRTGKTVTVVPPAPVWAHPVYGGPAPVCTVDSDVIAPPLQAGVRPEVHVISGIMMPPPCMPSPAPGLPVQVVHRQVAAAVANMPRAQQSHLKTPDLEAHCNRMVHMGDTILLEGDVRLMSHRNGKPLHIEAQRVIVNTQDGTLTVESDCSSKETQNGNNSQPLNRASQVIPVPVQGHVVPAYPTLDPYTVPSDYRPSSR